MTFVSYAQNFEDVMLWRALGHVSGGFYVDAGAASPKEDSVTRHFSDRGWSGINIEPNSEFHTQLVEQRPHDMNLNVAVGDQPGRLQLNLVGVAGGWTGLSTLREDFADAFAQEGRSITQTQVDVVTLAQIFGQHVAEGRDIHFLKVDVEGFEREALSGNDWTRWRPWIVVVESMLPNRQVENHEGWENVLTDAGYTFVYADGLNRFYAAEERSDLAAAFRYPPNVFDDFRLATYPAAVGVAAEERARTADTNHQSMATISRLEFEKSELAARIGTLQRDATDLAADLERQHKNRFSSRIKALTRRLGLK